MKINVVIAKELKDCSDEELLHEIRSNSEDYINTLREVGFDPTLVIERKAEMLEEAKYRGIKHECGIKYE
jgi:hypothetical protein